MTLDKTVNMSHVGTMLGFCKDNAEAIGISMEELKTQAAGPQGFPHMVFHLTIALYVVVFLIGIIGNSLVVYVVMRYSKMQTVTNMYILNLAIADEMFLVCLVFLISTMVYKTWMFGRNLCKIYMTITSINQFTSSLLLAVMSLDRYIAVCHPISAPKYRTPFIAKFICLTVWTVAAVLMVPIFMYSDLVESPVSGQPSCTIVWPDIFQTEKNQMSLISGASGFTVYSFTLGFFVPCIAIFVFYILVICRLRTVGPKNKSKEKRRSHRKVTFLVLTVISIYVFCWLPYWIGQLYIAFNSIARSDFLLLFSLLSSCLSYINSAVNPILYAFLSENFKKSFYKAFQCAAKKDVNAQLAVENSVFPRPNTLATANTTGPASRRSLMGRASAVESEAPSANCGLAIGQTPNYEDSAEINSSFGQPEDQPTEPLNTQLPTSGV